MLDSTKINTATMNMIKLGYEQAHARPMTEADMRKLSLAKAKVYLTLARQTAAANKTPAMVAGNRNDKHHTKRLTIISTIVIIVLAVLLYISWLLFWSKAPEPVPSAEPAATLFMYTHEHA